MPIWVTISIYSFTTLLALAFLFIVYSIWMSSKKERFNLNAVKHGNKIMSTPLRLIVYSSDVIASGSTGSARNRIRYKILFKFKGMDSNEYVIPFATKDIDLFMSLREGKSFSFYKEIYEWKGKKAIVYRCFNEESLKGVLITNPEESFEEYQKQVKLQEKLAWVISILLIIFLVIFAKYTI